MLSILSDVEKDLPQLVHRPEIWESLDIDYHPPRVERLWTPWREYRIYLHKIHPCEPADALFHPHPWPSAMRVCSGTYEMTVGYGKGQELPPVACRMIVRVGMAPEASMAFWYEMTDPDAWHAVRPINAPCYTVMVTGKPWGREAPKADHPLKPLSSEQKDAMIKWYSRFYPLEEKS